MKFKVGDIIKGNKISNGRYCYTDSRMTKARVIEVNVGNNPKKIAIIILEHTNPHIIGHKFIVTDMYFDLVEDKKETIVIYRKDNEVTALDKSTGKKAVAKCSPQDKFDFYTGAKLALDRLTRNVTFRVLCVKTKRTFDNKPYFSKGKVYEFIDGVTKWDTGGNSFKYSDYENLIARNTGWRSHFVELKEGDNPEEILKKYNNTIKKGDTVKVIDKGQTYTTFVDWVEHNIEYKTDRYKWDYNKIPSNGDTGRVIAIEKHNEDCKAPVLAYVEIKGRCYIISVEGLEKC